MPVQIEYNKGAVAPGYQRGHSSVYPQQVEVTGARSEVDRSKLHFTKEWQSTAICF